VDSTDQPHRVVGTVGVKCVEAQADLRVGGVYRIANQLPDGKIIWITGKHECVEFPRKLVYTWRVEGVLAPIERVTVEFELRNEATEVIGTHERILSLGFATSMKLAGTAVLMARLHTQVLRVSPHPKHSAHVSRYQNPRDYINIRSKNIYEGTCSIPSPSAP